MTKIGHLLIFVSAIFLFYIYLGYPAILAVLSLFRRRTQRPSPGYTPTISVLIAAYNEEASIAAKIQNTLSLEYPADKLEVLVASDGSSDRTDAIVKSFTDARVRLLRINDRRGKTNVQNEGAKHCRGEIIVFSDAAAMYHPQALLYLACNYVDPGVGAVSGRYKYFDPEDQSPTSLGSVAFWSYENIIKKLQSRVSTLTGCSGCIYSVRRDLYTPLPLEACSDLVEPLHIVKKGYRVVFEERALAYEETTKSASQEFRMRVRVISQGFYAFFLMRDLLKFWKYGWVSFQLLSHKICRWLIPLYLALFFTGCLMLADRPWAFSLLLLQIAFYAFGALSMLVPLQLRWKVLTIPLYFCTINAAILVSFVQFLRGNKYAVWETQRN